MQSTVPAVTREGYGYDPQRGELWFAGETAEAVLLELEARRARARRPRRRRSPSRRGWPSAPPPAPTSRRTKAEAAFAAAAPRLRIRRADVGTLKALLAAAGRLERALEALDRAVDVVEAPLRARGEAGAERTAALGAIAARARRDESGAAPRSSQTHAEGAAAAERDLTRLGGKPASSAEPGDAETLARWRCARSSPRPTRPRAEAAELGVSARAAEAARIDAAVRAGRRRARPHQLARVLAGAGAARRRRSPAPPTRRRASRRRFAHTSTRAERAPVDLGEELRRLGAAEVELRQALTNASASVSAIDVEVARIEAEADEARRRLEHAGTDERAEGDDRDELAERAERLERRRESLGQVNPLAKEEYDAEKVRLEELATQRKDLEQSLTELEKLRAELTETVERRFNETFDAVQRNFAEVAATLFPGGEGRLRLTESGGRRGASPASRSSCGRPARRCSGCRSSPAARRRSARSRSSSRSSSRGRARSICSTRSRRRSTTRTSAASSSCCASTPTARSSS